MKLNPHELAAVLAGLRLLQSRYGSIITVNPASELGAISDILRSEGDVEALGPSEIDALCERLNMQAVPNAHELACKALAKIAGWPMKYRGKPDARNEAIDKITDLAASFFTATGMDRRQYAPGTDGI